MSLQAFGDRLPIDAHMGIGHTPQDQNKTSLSAITIPDRLPDEEDYHVESREVSPAKQLHVQETIVKKAADGSIIKKIGAVVFGAISGFVSGFLTELHLCLTVAAKYSGKLLGGAIGLALVFTGVVPLVVKGLAAAGVIDLGGKSVPEYMVRGGATVVGFLSEKGTWLALLPLSLISVGSNYLTKECISYLEKEGVISKNTQEAFLPFYTYRPWNPNAASEFMDKIFVGILSFKAVTDKGLTKISDALPAYSKQDNVDALFRNKDKVQKIIAPLTAQIETALKQKFSLAESEKYKVETSVTDWVEKPSNIRTIKCKTTVTTIPGKDGDKAREKTYEWSVTIPYEFNQTKSCYTPGKVELHAPELMLDMTLDEVSSAASWSNEPLQMGIMDIINEKVTITVIDRSLQKKSGNEALQALAGELHEDALLGQDPEKYVEKFLEGGKEIESSKVLSALRFCNKEAIINLLRLFDSEDSQLRYEVTINQKNWSPEVRVICKPSGKDEWSFKIKLYDEKGNYFPQYEFEKLP